MKQLGHCFGLSKHLDVLHFPFAPRQAGFRRKREDQGKGLTPLRTQGFRLALVLRGLSGVGLCGVSNFSTGLGKIAVSPAGEVCCL
jgi:hypothetical protein